MSIKKSILANDNNVEVKLHKPMNTGEVVKINVATQAASNPADNDNNGVFGVLVTGGVTGEYVSTRIRGMVNVKLGATATAGNYVLPQADNKVDPSTASEMSFIKIFENGDDGDLVVGSIVSQ